MKNKIYTKDVILVMAASFFFMFSIMFITPLINGYAKDLGATASVAGLVVGIMSVAAIFLRPIAGNLTDRVSKYRLSVTGGFLIIIGIVGYILSPSVSWLLFFRIINGVGYVLCTVCMTTWLAALAPREHVGEAMGFYGLMNALAMALAPGIAINLYHRIGYRQSIWTAVIAAILMVITINLVSNRAQPNKQQIQKQWFFANFKFIQFRVIPVAVLLFLFAVPYFITQADIVDYVEQSHWQVNVGAYFLIYAVILLIIRMSLKNYFDTIRFGIWFWFSILGTAFSLLMLTMMTNNCVMALAATGMAIGYGMIYSVLQSTALLLAPMAEQGLASATFYLGLDFGMSFGPMIGGLIDDYLPVHDFYPAQLIILPVAIIIYLIYRQRLNKAIEHQH